MNNTNYTISIYTENNVGLLNRISAIFLKRHINIKSITCSESEISNVYRFIIVVNVNDLQILKLVRQIEKQIEVIAAFFHTDDETIFLETALYKVKSKSLFEERQIQNIINQSQQLTKCQGANENANTKAKLIQRRCEQTVRFERNGRAESPPQ